MFYVKERLNDAMEVVVEINDENVFSHCIHCGKELQVNLEELFADGSVDLSSTGVVCTTCAGKILGDEDDGGAA